MSNLAQGSAQNSDVTRNGNNTTPLIIVTILFFMWGLLTSLNDVLIPHLKSVYSLTYVQAMLVQFCFFSAYFVVSLPAGMLIKKIGYQKGAVTGLIIAASGCVLFYPAATNGYPVFLLALFILASGITILQVAANPYVTVLGSTKTASSRLTLTQAFNSLGTIIGPYLGGVLILGAAALTADQIASLSATELAEHAIKEAQSVQIPYLGLASALVALGLFFAFAKLPQIKHDDSATLSGAASLLSQKHLVLGAIGIFMYVGAEVSIGSLLVNFITQPHISSMTTESAAKLVALYGGGAMVGRFIGFAVMRFASPGKTLAFNCSGAILLVLVAVFTEGKLAMIALLGVGLFNSIMFPTIFSMALTKLGQLTSQGSGLLCMAIVGGAVVPLFTGMLADEFNLHLALLLPAVCYMFILFFGLKYAKLHITSSVTEANIH